MKLGAVAGHAGTHLPRRLGIREGDRVAVIAAPRGYPEALAELPGVHVHDTVRGRNDVIVFFAARRNELSRRFASFVRSLDRDGGLWIAWPKRTSGVITDLTENEVREVGLGAGLVDNKVCAIDETWSGLRFVYRVEDRRAGVRPPAKRAR